MLSGSDTNYLFDLMSKRKQDYFSYPIGRLFFLFQAKIHLILTSFFSGKQDNHFYLSRKSFLIYECFYILAGKKTRNISKKSIFCRVVMVKELG